MDKKICLDTDACIEIINDKPAAVKILDKIKNFEVFISSITLFELLLRTTNLEKIESFLKYLEVLDFDENSARLSSTIYKYLKNKGQLMDFRDIFIASIAITNDCKLATLNKKHFNRVKELSLLDL